MQSPYMNGINPNYNNVKKNKLISEVVVATCDKIIFDFIKSLNGVAIMTSKKHKRASDRCYEAMQILERRKKIKYDIIVMVQGDEPMINSKMISDSIQPLLNNKKINVVNLITSINNRKDFEDPNFIKVVHDKNYNALSLFLSIGAFKRTYMQITQLLHF